VLTWINKNAYILIIIIAVILFLCGYGFGTAINKAATDKLLQRYQNILSSVNVALERTEREVAEARSTIADLRAGQSAITLTDNSLNDCIKRLGEVINKLP
jgi:hypothetical protein